MSIIDKLEEIREKPEHIRHRYVIGAVAAAMLFILAIWIFSMRDSFKSALSKEEGFSGLKESFEESTKNIEMPSLEDVLKESEITGNEGIDNPEIQNNQAEQTNPVPIN